MKFKEEYITLNNIYWNSFNFMRVTTNKNNWNIYKKEIFSDKLIKNK